MKEPYSPPKYNDDVKLSMEEEANLMFEDQAMKLTKRDRQIGRANDKTYRKKNHWRQNAKMKELYTMAENQQLIEESIDLWDEENPQDDFEEFEE